MALLSEFLRQTYNFMNSIYVPGFHVSFMSVFLGAFGAVVSIAILKLIFGLGNSAISSTGSTIRGSIQRGGNNKNIKISKEREGDSK